MALVTHHRSPQPKVVIISEKSSQRQVVSKAEDSTKRQESLRNIPLADEGFSIPLVSMCDTSESSAEFEIELHANEFVNLQPKWRELLILNGFVSSFSTPRYYDVVQLYSLLGSVHP